MSALFNLSLDWEGFERDKYVHTVLEDNLLPNFIQKCRWFAGKAKSLVSLKIKDAVRLTHLERTYFFLIFETKYTDGDPENYLLPVSFVPLTEIEAIAPEGKIVPATLDDVEGFLVDATFDASFRAALFVQMGGDQAEKQKNGYVLDLHRGKAYTEISDFNSYLPAVDSSNTAFIYSDTFFFKLYRKLFSETNPEVEMVEYITQNSTFNHIPRFAGSVTWQRHDRPHVTFGMMVEVIENEKDDWSKTGDYLHDFIQAFVQGDFQIRERVFDQVTLLAHRTAQMHEALFNVRGPEDFRADPFDRAYRRFIHHKMETLLENRYQVLTDHYMNLDPIAQKLAWTFMESKDLIIDFIDQILTRPLESFRTRVHGDFHLGQVLVCQDDLKIIDFEGEPESSITHRKIKHSPLKDVAGMIRSYHYAVSAKLFHAEETAGKAEQELERAAERWYRLIRDTYLSEYLQYFGPGHLLFKNNNEINYLLQFHLLEKSVYELGYEINYRPTWVRIPLKGIVEVIREIEKLRR